MQKSIDIDAMAFIAHLAIYCKDLETMRSFYMKHFNANSTERYTNVKKGFHSYFLSFGESTMRLELMTRIDVVEGRDIQHTERLRITHFAIQLDSKEGVNHLTDTLQKDGYRVVGAPRTTGDGYYESVILDPEGNRVELVG